MTIVQDPQQMASPLWLSSLHFLAVCLSEECKQRAKSVQEGQYYVVHRLDTAPRDGKSLVLCGIQTGYCSQRW